MKAVLTKLALTLVALVAAATARAQQPHFGADLTTKGFEDVVVLDNTTLNIVVGGDDGTAAAPIFSAMRNAQLNPVNAAPPSLTQRVFARYMPPVAGASSIPDIKSSDVQSLLIKRKSDVLAAKRFLLPLKLEPLFDPDAKNVGGGMPPVVRDSMSRSVVRFVTGGFLDANFWVKDDQTKQVSFMYCWKVTENDYYNFHGNTGRAQHCMGLTTWKELNLPIGLFVSDLSKLGDLGWTGAIGGQRGTSTLRAGVIVTADGRSGSGGNNASVQGRWFVAHDIVVWDSATGEVVAGPFSIEQKSADVVYATNNCGKTTNGLTVVNDPAGNCSKLNPTLGAGWTYDAPTM